MVTLQVPHVGLASNNITYFIRFKKNEFCPFVETVSYDKSNGLKACQHCTRIRNDPLLCWENGLQTGSDVGHANIKFTAILCSSDVKPSLEMFTYQTVLANCLHAQKMTKYKCNTFIPVKYTTCKRVGLIKIPI